MATCPNCGVNLSYRNIEKYWSPPFNPKMFMRCNQCKIGIRPKAWALYVVLQWSGWMMFGAILYNIGTGLDLPSWGFVLLFLLFVASFFVTPFIFVVATFRAADWSGDSPP
jgi:hypothetical protein